MSNDVVVNICNSLAQVGIASLRFNYRGVGGSQRPYSEGEVGRSPGAFQYGNGDVNDTLDALRFLVSYDGIDQHSVGLAGCAYGTVVALKAAIEDDRPKAVSLVGRPRLDHDMDLGPRRSLPLLFMTGSRDSLMPVGHLSGLASSLTIVPETHAVPGADHFFIGQEREAGDGVAAFSRRWLKLTSVT